MTTSTVVTVAGARPNFMKVAPIHRAAVGSSVLEPVLIHTDQHYDPLMSQVFFSDLGMDPPQIRLDVRSGSHAEQTARVMVRLEPHLERLRPVAVVVVGDVNSTMAAALCAVKLEIAVVHVEAGLRSFDRRMPEEINRVVTDAVSDLLLAPSDDAVENLRREGHADAAIRMVGNVMIDSLDSLLPMARASSILGDLGLMPGAFFVATLHRPSNVDDGDRLRRLVGIFAGVSRRKPLVFVVHPRTAAALGAGDRRHLEENGVILLEPVGYIDFLALEAASAGVLTDSGGIQEETTVLGVPCLTLRPETERPVTVTSGTNHVVGDDEDTILRLVDEICDGRRADRRRPPLWDGQTAGRIVRLLEERYA